MKPTREQLEAIRAAGREIADAADTALDHYSNDQVVAEQLQDARTTFAGLVDTFAGGTA